MLLVKSIIGMICAKNSKNTFKFVKAIYGRLYTSPFYRTRCSIIMWRLAQSTVQVRGLRRPSRGWNLPELWGSLQWVTRVQAPPKPPPSNSSSGLKIKSHRSYGKPISEAQSCLPYGITQCSATRQRWTHPLADPTGAIRQCLPYSHMQWPIRPHCSLKQHVNVIKNIWNTRHIYKSWNSARDCQNAFSFRGLRPLTSERGALPLDPAGGSAIRPPL